MATAATVDRSTKMSLVRDAVLTEIERRGWSRYRLAKACAERGVHDSCTYAWLRGHRGISLDVAETILTVLGLRIVPGEEEQAEIDPAEEAAALRRLAELIERRLPQPPEGDPADD